MPRSVQERIADADEKASRYLADANEAQASGLKERADRLYERSQRWLDESNRLRGNGDAEAAGVRGR